MNSNNNWNFFGFQLTDPGVPKAKHTLAILSSKFTMNKTLEELKDDYLEPFVEDHTDWCRKVTKFVLEKKNRSWRSFKQEWLADAFPLCEIRITFLLDASSVISVYLLTHITGQLIGMMILNNSAFSLHTVEVLSLKTLNL